MELTLNDKEGCVNQGSPGNHHQQWGRVRMGVCLCFRELADMVVVAGKSEVRRAGWRPRKSWYYSSSLQAVHR